MRIRVASSPKGAANCTPMGRPDSLSPNGKEIEGVPVTLNSPMCWNILKSFSQNSWGSRSSRLVLNSPWGCGNKDRLGVINKSYYGVLIPHKIGRCHGIALFDKLH